ncbi:hypothetical protein [Pseudaminobacter soli (ex Li et al. 2025)]|uniref:Uncharacterized protein n=1 Tax=Pseudaminobacter soli (ex Li et al. 2025) TaxID=1295366 RepID=A0A2P7SEI3_9HYPH|nr:hypothetical protein [Mesorhizobium soli]PSJ60775.1 hypothetical protein C7I85_12090 [Mesorhizobium soli]
MTATAGHNSNELTENERKALFFHHLRKRMEHNANLAEINAEKKADAKIAQADGQVIGDIDYAIKALNADDKATVTDRFIAAGEILSWLGLTPGFQSDMFRDRAPAVDRIEKDGELAGLAGRDPKSPYDTGSNEDLAWMRGWDNGQQIMRDNLEAAMTKRNAAKSGDELIQGGADDGDPFEMEDAA